MVRAAGPWVLVLALALAPPSGAGPQGPEDGAHPAGFFELARPGTPAALEALERALAGLRDEDLARRAYGAFGLFRGTAQEGEAVRRLARIAFSERRSVQVRGAVHALTLLGPAAEEPLARVLERHSDPVARSIALRPLLPALAAAGGEASARLVLAHADLESGLGPGVAAVLERCRDRGSELAMARELRNRQRSAAWKLLLVEVLARREGGLAGGALEGRLADGDRAVRLAAMGELARRDPPAALDALRRLARAGDEQTVCDAIVTLGTLRDAHPDWISELAGFARSREPETRRAVTAALAELGTREALWLLHRMLGDEDWRVQVEAVRAVASLRQRESVPRLVPLVEAAHSRVQSEAQHALRLLTGVDQGTTRARWTAWFEGEGASFEVPPLAEALAAERARRERSAAGATTTFYGLRVDSRHVSFVLDTSGSMSARAGGGPTTSHPEGSTRLEVAVHELGRALNNMLDGARFNLIAFAARAQAFAPSLVTLDGRSRQRALRYAAGLRASGGTNLHDAVLLALADPEVDTIFLLTDGQPTVGSLVDPEAIRAAVRELNRERQVRIHGVAVGIHSPLLEGLAEDTGGQYREIR